MGEPKANSNLSILKLLGKNSCGAECVSIGEIKRSLISGIPARNIIFDGVGKTTQELKFALGITDKLLPKNTQLKQINAESREELEELNGLVANTKLRPNVALRLNTDTDARTHKYLSTGRSCDKFGIPIPEVQTLCKNWADEFPNLNFVGLTVHSGSQISSLEPYRHAYGVLKDVVKYVQEFTSLTVRTLDLGGGVGVSYDDFQRDFTVDLHEYGNLVKEIFDVLNVELLLEPGRCIVADAGCLLATVIRVKTALGGARCAIIDAGMNDLMRPALYGARHNIIPVYEQEKRSETIEYQIAGPICESADVFVEKASFFSELKRGNLLAIINCGAYGFSMGNRYNSRCLPAEVLVDFNDWTVVGKRESLEDALRRER